MKKFFTSQDFAAAMTILNFLHVKTDCFDADGTILPAAYLVAIDDDPTSAFYASYLYHRIYQIYDYHPIILCVGSKGPLSKYVNQDGESEGMKLRRVCLALAVLPRNIVVLDKGKRLHDIIKQVSLAPGMIIMCLTERSSFLIKQTLLALDKQHPELAEDCKKIMSFGVHYYAPELDADEQMKIYNAKGLAGGVMWLAEIAFIYGLYLKYVKIGKMAKFEGKIPDNVIKASELLAVKYPLRSNRYGFAYVWQFAYAFVSVMLNKRNIEADLQRAIRTKQEEFLGRFDFMGQSPYGLYLKGKT